MDNDSRLRAKEVDSFVLRAHMRGMNFEYLKIQLGRLKRRGLLSRDVLYRFRGEKKLYTGEQILGLSESLDGCDPVKASILIKRCGDLILDMENIIDDIDGHDDPEVVEKRVTDVLDEVLKYGRSGESDGM